MGLPFFKNIGYTVYIPWLLSAFFIDFAGFQEEVVIFNGTDNSYNG